MPESIKEHDRVVLTAAVPANALEPGDVGTVVHVYASGAYEVEFFTLQGKTIAVATVEAGQARPVSGRDILHTRTLPD
jgi:hypothetical protein